jgi:hypothetical protein
MDRICDWFNRYQDGELSPEEETRFFRHMTACDACSARNHVLDNLAHAFKNLKFPEPHRSPELISSAAFRRSRSWDVLSLYWPRPAIAWSSFAFLLMIFSFLWILPSIQKPGIGTEYEMLMTDSDLSNPNQDNRITPTDDELFRWLEQGGEIQ